MKNYLEHDDKVRYGDGLLAHSQEWQWFVDLLHETFEVNEVRSWKEYENSVHTLRNVFSYFVRILEVSDRNWNFPKSEFAEIWEIARYFLGKQTRNECFSRISTMYGKIMLFCVWITKLSNASQGGDVTCIYDIRILKQRNFFQLIDLQPYLDCEEEIFDYAKKINVEGFSVPLGCLSDNLQRIEYPVNEEFLVQNKDKILNYNAISFQSVPAGENISWQENYLLDMLKVSVSNKKLQPMFSWGHTNVPDIALWREEHLYQMKTYFNHECADFLIDSIWFVLYGKEPAKETKLMHLRLLTDVFEEKRLEDIVASSSFAIISALFEDKKFKDCADEQVYRDFMKTIHSITEEKFILSLAKNFFPITRQQSLVMNAYYQSKYKKIVHIDDAYKLTQFFGDEDNATRIDDEHLKIAQSKFDSCVASDEGIIISNLFYKYMVFLICANSNNQNANKKWIHSEMIRIQQLWQNDVFMSQTKNMQTFSFSHQIPSRQVERFNEQVILNPILFAKECIPCSEEKIIEIMQCTSEHPLIHMVSKTVLTPVFPNGSVGINLERHDIDNLLAKKIRMLLDTVGYKFLNILEINDYLLDIHERYTQNTHISVSLFRREQELYNIIQAETDIPLVPFSEGPCLAMLTQLFPILEMKVREFAAMFGIFPFKKNLNEFMQHNDPSTLLREILMRIYDEQESFENVPDLLFVYNIMYNSNSMNIRNECVHGRNYLRDNSLNFAITATLFAVYMITFRINTIKANVSDLLESPE